MSKTFKENLPSLKVSRNPDIQELGNLSAQQISPSLGDGKVKMTISKTGCEVTYLTSDGTSRQYFAANSGLYKSMSEANIRGASRREQQDIVNDLRKQGLTQNQVALRLGVSQSYISQIENSD